MVMLPLQLVTVIQPRAARVSMHRRQQLLDITTEQSNMDVSSKSELKYKDVIKITTDPPAQRAKKDILSVCDWIKKISPLFAEMDKDIAYNVMKNCKCQITLKDTVVVQQGDKGDAFYIILHGQVSVFIKEEEKKSLLSELLESDEEPEKPPETPENLSEASEADDEEKVKDKTPTVRSKFRRTLTKLKVTQLVKPKFKKKVVEEKPDPRKTLGVKVATIGDGKSFGELALQNSDNKRAASCVTDTDVVFLVVDRQLYNKSIKSFQAKQLALIRGFVTQHPFFEHWPPKLQSQVQNSVTQVKLQGGDWVIKQGQTYNGIYFLISGEVRVILNGQLHVKQYEESKPTDEYEKLIAGNMTTVSLLGHQEVMRSLSQAHVHVRRREGYSAAESYQQSLHKNVCLSGPSIMFGDLEHVLGLQTYVQTIQTEGLTRLLHISKDNLGRLLKLANNMGHLVSTPTVTAMARIAYETWSNRVQRLCMDDLACLDRLISNLMNHPNLRLKSPIQTTATREERLFQYLIKAYLAGQGSLITPHVEGNAYYRLVMQEKAEIRRRQKKGRGPTRPPRSLRPLLNDRKPRSISLLKDAIKKHQTSDVDVIIPQRRSFELDPLPPVKPAAIQEPASNIQTQEPSKEESIHYNRQNATLGFVENAENVASEGLGVITEETETGHSLQTTEQAETRIPDENIKSIAAEHVSDPILITELKAPPKCYDKETDPLVQGKTLKFYSQYLRGRLDKEYEKAGIDPEIIQCNNDAALIEQKLIHFIDPNNNLPEKTTAVKKLNRLDLNKTQSVLPGGKCYVQKSPCKLLRRSLLTNNKEHSHIRHHMV